MSNLTARKNELEIGWELQDRREARLAIASLEPQTALGAKLIALALRGIDEGVAPLDDEHMAEYLGRNQRSQASKLYKH